MTKVLAADDESGWWVVRRNGGDGGGRTGKIVNKYTKGVIVTVSMCEHGYFGTQTSTSPSSISD